MKPILACAGAALLVVGANAAFAAAGTTFIKDAIQGDNAEIKMGQLAQQNGSGQGVKSYGETLVSDHTMAKSQADSVAQKMGVKPPSGVSQEAQQTYDKLAKLSGAEFDREFLKDAVKDHRKDIAKYQHEASAKDGPASDMAAKQLPTLEKHLRMAENLETGKQASAQ